MAHAPRSEVAAVLERRRSYNPAAKRRYREAHLEQIRAADRAYYWTHREKILACAQQRRDQDPDKYRDYQRAWQSANKDHVQAYERMRGERDLQRIKFQGKRIRLASNPRTGVCSRCGRVRQEQERQFDLHHAQYDSLNPTAHTMELCGSCHAKHHAAKGSKAFAARCVRAEANPLSPESLL